MTETITLIILAIAILLCVVGSNFFSSSEMSFSSANQVRLEHEAEDGSGKAKSALYIIEHFDNALSTILIGNNLVNIAASSLVTIFVIKLAGSDKYTWVGTIVITILIIIFGETIAKIIAKKKPNTLAMNYAYLIRGLMIVFFPLVWVVVKLTHLITLPIKVNESSDEDESVEAFQSILETAEDEGVIDSDRTELLQAAIDFSEKAAYEVMTARVDLEAIDLSEPMEEIMARLEETPYSRIPVYEEDVDHIIGVLHANHLLKALANGEAAGIRDLLMPPCYVYKTIKLPQVLNILKRAKQHLAIVTDEYGANIGVITIEDVLEELVGEIWDEKDEVEEEVIERRANEFEIDGDMNVSDFFEMCDMQEMEDEFDSETIGGCIMEHLRHYPVEGEEFVYGEAGGKAIRFKVLSMDDRRVDKIWVKIEEA